MKKSEMTPAEEIMDLLNACDEIYAGVLEKLLRFEVPCVGLVGLLEKVAEDDGKILQIYRTPETAMKFRMRPKDAPDEAGERKLLASLAPEDLDQLIARLIEKTPDEHLKRFYESNRENVANLPLFREQICALASEGKPLDPVQRSPAELNALEIICVALAKLTKAEQSRIVWELNKIDSVEGQ